MPYPPPNKTFGKVVAQAVRKQINKSVETFIPARVINVYLDEMRVDVILKFKVIGGDPKVLRKIPVVLARGGNSGYLAPVKVDDIVLVGFSKHSLQTLLSNKSILDQTPGNHSVKFSNGPFAIAGFVLWDEVGQSIFEVGANEQASPLWEIPTDGPKQVSDENYLLHARKYIKLGGDSLWVWDDVDWNALSNPNWLTDNDRPVRIGGSDVSVGRQMLLDDYLYGTWLVPATWNGQPIDVFVELISSEPTYPINNHEFNIAFRGSREGQSPDSNPDWVQIYVPLSSIFIGSTRYRGQNNPIVSTFTPPGKFYAIDFSLHYTSAQFVARTVYITRVIFRWKIDQLGWAKNFEVIP